MSSQRVLLTLTLLGLALASWWLSQDQEARLRGDGPDTKPDYYAENLLTIEFDAQGKPKRRLQTQRMEHYAADDSLHLTQPQMLIFDPGLPPWSLRANSGWISGDRKDVWFRGQVFVDREADGVNSPYHMVTSELHLKRQPDYAETDQPVYLVTDRDQVESIGMQLWLEPETRLKFLSQVRGRFEPQD
ncbi:MAG: LPS export ABC transporter periplasmic protein LptC [Gammaproteobacteria bacterium]|nr:LPS export ABC transporter periplasmic protein LptC [Gammaproteobacteria bacterium]